MALDERRRAHANSFGAVADAYERGRPPYPTEAIDWLVPALAGGGEIALHMVTHCSRADLPG